MQNQMVKCDLVISVGYDPNKNRYQSYCG